MRYKLYVLATAILISGDAAASAQVLAPVASRLRPVTCCRELRRPPHHQLRASGFASPPGKSMKSVWN
jgi:hypothetical protein